MDAKRLKELSEGLFTKRSSLMSLWQEQAENFYPERADFTITRSLGTDFASNLMTSYPLLCRRDLGDQFNSMLRPTAKDWWHMATKDERREDNDGKRWLEWAAGTQRRAMYDPVAKFTRATKEGDHDYATFGQCVISGRLNRNANALLYRCFHLKDVAWMENEEQQICMIARRWKPTAQDLCRMFPKTVDQKIVRENEKKPFTEYRCEHWVVEADMYDGKSKGLPYWSVYYDCQNEKVLEEIPVWTKEYVIPRWQTVSGSQYAYSPATVAALPDARLLQAMTGTLLEAGEKIVNPPMIATQEAVRSDVAIYPGGITWVDIEYDEKLGAALRPLTTDAKGMPIGVEMQRDARVMLMQAFYLNKLSLPQRSPEMTAYEVGQRIQQYIRDAMPLFEPMEMDYNGGLCELTFDILMRAGAFGSVRDMPKSLQGADIEFRFESPLHDAIEQQKGAKLLETQQMIAAAMQMDPTAVAILDGKAALRDVLNGIRTPAKWLRSEIEVEAIDMQARQQQQSQQQLTTAQQSADVVKTLSDANAAAVPA